MVGSEKKSDHLIFSTRSGQMEPSSSNDVTDMDDIGVEISGQKSSDNMREKLSKVHRIQYVFEKITDISDGLFSC